GQDMCDEKSDRQAAGDTPQGNLDAQPKHFPFFGCDHDVQRGSSPSVAPGMARILLELAPRPVADHERMPQKGTKPCFLKMACASADFMNWKYFSAAGLLPSTSMAAG